MTGHLLDVPSNDNPVLQKLNPTCFGKMSSDATTMLENTKWLSFLCSSLDNMRHNNIMCDMSMTADDGASFPCHMSVLAACSPLLCASVGGASERPYNMRVQGMTGHVLQLLLQFVYSGNVTVTRDVTELTNVIRAADQLQLTHITGTCEDLLREIQGNMTTGAVHQNYYALDATYMHMECVLRDLDSGCDLQQNMMAAGSWGTEVEGTPATTLDRGTATPENPNTSLSVELHTPKVDGGHAEYDSDTDVDEEYIDKGLQEMHTILKEDMARRATYGDGDAMGTTAEDTSAYASAGLASDTVRETTTTRALNVRPRATISTRPRKLLKVKKTRTTLHKCELCGKTFTWHSSLRKHVAIWHDKVARPFACATCGKAFHFRSHLKGHELIHLAEKPHKCAVCDKSFTQRQQLTVHARTHTGERPYACAECGRAFSQKNGLVVHERTHTGEKPFACAVCGRAFNKKSRMKEHEGRVHGGVKRPAGSFPCPLCSKVFKCRSNLRCHELTHSGGKPFKCTVCGKAYANRRSARYHELTHTGVRPYQCSYCPLAFHTAHRHREHERRHTRGKQHACAACEKRFHTRAQLEVHARTHTGERPYMCSACGKSFSQKAGLVNHERTHTGEKPYPCAVCEKAFVKKSHLTRHERIHTGERPYQCSVCGKTFTTKRILVQHIRTHTGERPYACEVCGARFTQSSLLSVHRRIHSGTKPYKCSHCGKAFTRIHHMQRHELIHTGEKPFKCALCGKAYNQKTTLTLHRRRVHAGECDGDVAVDLSTAASPAVLSQAMEIAASIGVAGQP